MVSLAARSASVMPLLLAHYVSGAVAQTTWDAFSDAFDEATASDEERAAFAHFYLEIAGEGDAVTLPKPSELEDVLDAIHA
jgi:hypothetical protein